MAQAVAEYIRADVMPQANHLLVQEGYLRRYLQEEDIHTYAKGLTQLGAALNYLPQDFNVSMINDRRKDLQAHLRDAVSILRPVYAKLPGAKTYLDRLEQLLQLTTMDQIGHEVDQQLKRQDTQH